MPVRQLAMLLLVVAALLAVPLSTDGQPPQATFLAVVDEHGRLTPIAVYDGTTWWNRWPWAAESEKVRNLPLPPSLAAIPADWLPPGLRLPVDWLAFSSGKLVSFRALRPTRRGDFALMDTVLVGTTYRGRRYDEDRLAISGPGVLENFAALSNAEADAIIRELRPRIATLEADEIARWRKEATAGGETDIALTRTYMVTDPTGTRYVSTPPPGDARDYGLVTGLTRIDGRTYHYLRGEKLFKLRPGDECMMHLSTEGFVVVGAAGHIESETIGAGAFSEFCGDAPELVYQLATIAIGRRTWWVVKIGLEDGYDYGLMDPLTGDSVEIKGLWALRSNDRER